MKTGLTLFLLLTPFIGLHAAPITLIAPRVATLPVVDGVGDEAIWQQAKPVAVQDPVADIPITLQAVHDGETIVILTRYPDENENREHKTMIWDEEIASYRTGPEREDTLVLKWAMSPLVKELTLQSEHPYQADIWYWKAHRTDPVGYADDKYQIYSRQPSAKAMRLKARNGELFYLLRKGDGGNSSYETNVLLKKHATREPKYTSREPSGSRADIRAKGRWHEGVWQIEMARKLDTGNGDDIKLTIGEKHLFGVSRYEIAGRPRDHKLQQPDFGSGEIGQPLLLLVEE